VPLIDIEYVHRDSPVHRLHPFVLLVFELCVFVAASVFNHPLVLLALLAAVAAAIALAGIPPRRFRYLWVVAAVMLIFVVTQGVWFTSFGSLGESAADARTLFHLWPGWLPGGPRVPFVLEGAVYGLALGLRFLVIALAFPLLVMTTHPRDLVTALSRVRVGRHRLPDNLIFVFTNALRYVPTISKQFDETMDAQRARGVEFDGRNPVRRVRATFPLLLPVITSSLVRARDLTLALETRAFGAQGERTFYHEVRLRRVDVVVAALLVVAAALCVVAGRGYGLGQLPYVP
jgi:energy-coupling factor transport system permease protein